MKELTIRFIDRFKKIIDKNECWIPLRKPEVQGYVRVMIDGRRYVLSRLSMCLHHNIDYHNQKVETRHSMTCDRACFNYNHLRPGTPSDNNKDTVLHGRHHEANKSKCPHCGGPYMTLTIQTGENRGKQYRKCVIRCDNHLKDKER